MKLSLAPIFIGISLEFSALLRVFSRKIYIMTY